MGQTQYYFATGRKLAAGDGFAPSTALSKSAELPQHWHANEPTGQFSDGKELVDDFQDPSVVAFFRVNFTRRSPRIWFLDSPDLVWFRLLVFRKINTHDGRVAIVTGPSKGIGQEIAASLAARGADLVLLDVDDNREEKEASEEDEARRTKKRFSDLAGEGGRKRKERKRNPKFQAVGLKMLCNLFAPASIY